MMCFMFFIGSMDRENRLVGTLFNSLVSNTSDVCAVTDQTTLLVSPVSSGSKTGALKRSAVGMCQNRNVYALYM